jgi:hypothetical protein
MFFGSINDVGEVPLDDIRSVEVQSPRAPAMDFSGLLPCELVQSLGNASVSS